MGILHVFFVFLGQSVWCPLSFRIQGILRVVENKFVTSQFNFGILMGFWLFCSEVGCSVVSFSLELVYWELYPDLGAFVEKHI